MTHGSLFSGIGGFDLAAEWMGWANKFHCEWNEFGQKVLNYYWPDAECFGDIIKANFKKYNGTIDIVSGGFPCQPYSGAGKRLGTEDDRHLWPEMLRAIREIQPRYVVGENVRGLTNWNGGMVFDQVQADLESEGYEVLPFLLPACAVNAPHRRDRIWFIAYNNERDRTENRFQAGREINVDRVIRTRYAANTAQTNEGSDDRSNRAWQVTKGQRSKLFDQFNNNGNNGAPADAKNNGCERWPCCNCRNTGQFHPNEPKWIKADGSQPFGRCELFADATCKRCGKTRQCVCGSSERFSGSSDERITSDSNEFDGNFSGFPTSQISQQQTSRYNVTHPDGERLRRQSDGFGKPRFFSEAGTGDNWQNFPTQSPVCSGDDGLSSRLVGITFSKHRNESLKAYGNAVVPELVYQIFKAIEQYENINLKKI